MDPLSVFSLASTILQFIDSGAKLAGLAWRLHHDDDGSDIDQLPELMRLTASLGDVLNTLEQPAASPGQNSGLHLLANECKEVAAQLLALLRKVGIPSNPSSRKRNALKLALQRTWNKSEIESLKARLDRFRAQFNVSLLVSLRQHATQSLARQEETLKALDISSQNSGRVEAIVDKILRLVASKVSTSDVAETTKSLRSALVTQVYQDHAQSVSATKLRIILTPEEEQRLHLVFLSTLVWQGMGDRESRILEAYHSTFQWVLSNDSTEPQKWHNLKEWLESEDQIYWITGKAGSGKSTLMKYLCQPVTSNSSRYHSPTSRCHESLNKWAGRKKLLFASFYFWNSDTQLQMSRIGLLRSLVYQILHQIPELISKAPPVQWEALVILAVQPGEWNEVAIGSILDKLVETATVDCKFCFFIDGLDEVAGSPAYYWKLSKALAKKDALETKPHLMLENLTYKDIKHYVSSNLDSDLEFKKLLKREPKFAHELIENIVAKAHGVFLWVRLVVASLLSGMSYGDRVVDLQKRLDFLPPDLENLYEKMMRSLDSFYLEHAAQLLWIMQASKTPLSLILFTFADEENSVSVVKIDGPMSSSELWLRLDAMARRINSRWKGLLEVDRAWRAMSPGDGARVTVQYLHRTVKDFINTSTVQDFLNSSLKTSFDPHLSLCVAYCPYTKTIPAVDEDLHLCLDHSARTMPSSEPAVLQVLQHMATTNYVRGAASTGPPRDTYFDLKKNPQALSGSWSCTLLSLAIKRGVMVYVKDCTKDGLLGRHCLLLDPVHATFQRINVVKLLLNLGADTNEAAWMELLQGIKLNTPKIIRSLNDLGMEDQLVVQAVVQYGANVNAAWEIHTQSYNKRFGSRKSFYIERDKFRDGFFEELKTIPVISKNRRRKGKLQTFFGLRRSVQGDSIREDTVGN